MGCFGVPRIGLDGSIKTKKSGVLASSIGGSYLRNTQGSTLEKGEILSQGPLGRSYQKHLLVILWAVI